MRNLTNIINEMVDYPETFKCPEFEGHYAEYDERNDCIEIMNANDQCVIRVAADGDVWFCGYEYEERVETEQELIIINSLKVLYSESEHHNEYLEEPGVF